MVSFLISLISEIIEHLKHPLTFGQILRPEFTHGVDIGGPKAIKSDFPKTLIESCWRENPAQRPTIQTVRDTVNRETKQ